MKRHIFFTVALILSTYGHQGGLAQESGKRGCPVISVSHPEPASTDRTLIYRAHIQDGDPSVTPALKWTVSVGKIVRGQGTSEVSVEVDGNNTFTVTVEVNGYAPNCPNKASNTRIVCKPAKPE